MKAWEKIRISFGDHRGNGEILGGNIVLAFFTAPVYILLQDSSWIAVSVLLFSSSILWLFWAIFGSGDFSDARGVIYFLRSWKSGKLALKKTAVTQVALLVAGTIVLGYSRKGANILDLDQWFGLYWLLVIILLFLVGTLARPGNWQEGRRRN